MHHRGQRRRHRHEGQRGQSEDAGPGRCTRGDNSGQKDQHRREAEDQKFKRGEPGIGDRRAGRVDGGEAEDQRDGVGDEQTGGKTGRDQSEGAVGSASLSTTFTCRDMGPGQRGHRQVKKARARRLAGLP
jgi:hypothetical protein